MGYYQLYSEEFKLNLIFIESQTTYFYFNPSDKKTIIYLLMCTVSTLQ